MTKEEKARRREAIKERYWAGTPAKDLAEEYNLSIGYIWQICEIGRKKSEFADMAPEILLRWNNGETQTAIAKSLGASRGQIYSLLKKHGAKLNLYKNTEEEAARRIFEKTGGRFEYVSGYTNKESNVLIRCAVCGGEFERTYHNLTTAPNPYGCPLCRKAQVERRNNEASAERFRRKLRTRAKEANSARQLEIMFCTVCGAPTHRHKYCSDKCASKVYNAQKEAKRRVKIKDAFVDKGINVKTLFRRDNGVCHICGKRCDHKDYVIKDDVFIAGDLYPSVDHVVPLCKGGTHSWDNVKLAHRLCNSIKGGNG